MKDDDMVEVWFICRKCEGEPWDSRSDGERFMPKQAVEEGEKAGGQFRPGSCICQECREKQWQEEYLRSVGHKGKWN